MKPCVVILDESCDLLEPEVSQFVPTVVFCRLGGFVVDPAVACEQLHQLIVERMASRHVIYVAASFAGFTALLLGSHYPSLVAGLILVDYRNQKVIGYGLRIYAPDDTAFDDNIVPTKFPFFLGKEAEVKENRKERG
jgi:hypothetical protein